MTLVTHQEVRVCWFGVEEFEDVATGGAPPTLLEQPLIVLSAHPSAALLRPSAALLQFDSHPFLLLHCRACPLLFSAG